MVFVKDWVFLGLDKSILWSRYIWTNFWSRMLNIPLILRIGNYTPAWYFDIMATCEDLWPLTEEEMIKIGIEV